MQTFLPYSDFASCAGVLDLRRLGKQIIEGGQILRTLLDDSRSWQSHPAVRMWRGHEASLLEYVRACAAEWRRRRGRDHGAWINLLAWLQDRGYLPLPPAGNPPWLGDERFHSSHRANLLRKYPEWYGEFDWDEDPATPYVWPVARVTGSRSISQRAGPR
jgi:hypothetical protein